MFNLLVSGSGWAEGRDTLTAGRAFEYTEKHLAERYKPADEFDFAALTSLPTLFVAESSGNGDQIARVGTITRARVSGRDIALEYTYDPGIPPISNKLLEGFCAELDINNFQFHRTHWSIKDVDLFRVLLRNMQPRRQKPKCFRLADPENIEPSLVSAMMPFHPAFDAVYAALKATCEAADLRCRRADDIWRTLP